jgi:hypothetical protein
MRTRHGSIHEEDGAADFSDADDEDDEAWLVRSSVDLGVSVSNTVTVDAKTFPPNTPPPADLEATEPRLVHSKSIEEDFTDFF